MGSLKMEINVSPNVYYMSISAMQKCIRRSMPDEAVRFAYVAWKCNKYRLFCRLWTVLFEDCGRNELALRAMYDHMSGYQEFEPLEFLVRCMAVGPKDRSVFSLSYIIGGKSLKPIFLHSVIKNHPVHKRVGDIVGRWHEEKTNVFDVLPDYTWVVELAARSESWDWEKGGIATPYFFNTETYQKPREACNRVHLCEPCTLYQDFFPLESVDCHTMPGKACCRIFTKKLPGKSAKDIENYFFYHEGCKIRDGDFYNYRFFLLDTDMSGYGHYLKPLENMEDHLKEMNEVRTWYLDKNLSGDMRDIKKLSEELK
jgi:hypothetical protein